MYVAEEWLMVADLIPMLANLPLGQASFVETLYKNLDPHMPFLEQQSEKQLKWLKFIHNKNINKISEW